MTTLSQYLQAERIDRSEPASFYVPGISKWEQLKSSRGQAGMISRSAAEKELLHSVDPEDVIEQ